MFVRMPASTYHALREQQKFQLMARHISPQVEAKRFRPDLEKLRKVPRAIQTVYWLWRFDCEAESGGFETLLLGHLGLESPHYHEALTEIGALELRDRLEAGIPIAAQSRAQFMLLPDKSWFLSFPLREEYERLKDVDRGTRPLYPDLRARAVQYIQLHKRDFLED